MGFIIAINFVTLVDDNEGDIFKRYYVIRNSSIDIKIITTRMLSKETNASLYLLDMLV